MGPNCAAAKATRPATWRASSPMRVKSASYFPKIYGFLEMQVFVILLFLPCSLPDDGKMCVKHATSALMKGDWARGDRRGQVSPESPDQHFEPRRVEVRFTGRLG